MAKATGVKIRNWRPEDVSAIVECQQAAYPHYSPEALCDERLYLMQMTAFPQGQFLAEKNGQVVGYATSLIVQVDDDAPWYSYSEITGVGTFSTHNSNGDTLYGADIAVRPEFHGQGISQLLYRKRRRLLERLNLRRMIAGGRIPGFREHAGRMTAEEYVEKVKAGELRDPALNAHLKAGYEVKGLYLDYMSDAESLNYTTILEMPNPHYRPEQRRLAAVSIRRPQRHIRVCAVQYRMRLLRSYEDFIQQVDFFVTSAEEYHCHYLLFPELFSAQLFSIFPPETETREAVAMLAGYTGRIVELFKEMASRSRITIIAGSHPIEVNGQLRNRAFLITPSGGVYHQDKLHITPGERLHWGIQPGEELCLFDTGWARLGIQVCYDIEFPEASRLLTLAGAEVIFVPFSTDERKSYMRVRHCAQARAVENALYVVLAGNVGNLPQVRSFLLNYGQAAICTPCDFAFPINGVAAEAEPNAETIVIADLDLGSLAVQREMGSVRPLRDRRPDLYDLTARIPIRKVRVE